MYVYTRERAVPIPENRDPYRFICF